MTNSPAPSFRTSLFQAFKRGVRLAAPPFAAVATAVVAPACASTQPRDNVADNLETPSYVEVERSGAFEIRRIKPQIVAATTVNAEDRDDASNKGFRILADYIFGGNVSQDEVAMTAPVSAAPQTSTGQNIEMTAPVGAQPVKQPAADSGSKIAMTAPVGAQPIAKDNTGETIEMTAPVATEPKANADGDQVWEITFMMPSEYTLETLPKPTDERVRLEPVPAQCKAAVVFSGWTTEEVVEEKTQELRGWLEDKDIAIDDTKAPTIARYNDPFTFPWNRRNEVLIDLKETVCETGDDDTKPTAPQAAQSEQDAPTGA